MTEEIKRRELLAAGSLTLGAYLLGGKLVWATAREATARGFTPQALSEAQLSALESLCEALVPGATEAGIGAYVDAQLAASNDSKLMAKYVGVPPEQQGGFYGAALDAVAAGLADHDASALAGLMAGDAVPDWQGPPASYVIFLLRSDALDVTYGTQQGFAELGIPYMAHIAPESSW
ncbi:MAG: Tat pathway signal protein [Pseudomonadota bacterium]